MSSNNSSNNSVKPDDLLSTQQNMQYYFKCYRQGDQEQADKVFESPEDEPEVFAHVTNLLQPAPGKWGGLRGSRYQNRVLKKLLEQKPMRQIAGSGRPTLEYEEEDAATKTINNVAAKLWRAKVKYLKTLGYGGQAMASLWECTHRNGTRSHVVLKTMYSSTRSARAELKKEKNWLTVCSPHDPKCRPERDLFPPEDPRVDDASCC